VTQMQTEMVRYPLGHAESELQRLMKQSKLLEPLTEHVFRRAGLTTGMKVLDLGCGAGDVSFLAAKIVGPTGSVVGIDKSAESIAMSQSRAFGRFSNVRFMQSDLMNTHLDEDFDALIGRLVLMYFPDPVAILRQMANKVRPDGVIVFHEFDCSQFPLCIPSLPLFDKCVYWIRESMTRCGAQMNMGFRLFETFREAGLGLPEMTTGSVADGRSESYVYDYVVDTVRSLMPMIESFGVATRAEVGIETLTERLRNDVLDAGAFLVSPLFVGAWAKKGLLPA
jgi:ubiquinone/menaquinone biosynthesis C-methylase UbiE